MSGYNANYRNSAADKDYRLAFNAGHTNASVPVRVPPSVGLNEIACDEIVTDELTTSTFRSLFRFSDIVKCQRYYSVLFSIQLDDENPDVLLYVRSAAFEPFVTVWRNTSTRFEVDPEQSTQVEKVIPINVTADITGPFILEVSSMNPYETGEFEVELVCGDPPFYGMTNPGYWQAYGYASASFGNVLPYVVVTRQLAFSGDPSTYTWELLSPANGLALSSSGVLSGDFVGEVDINTLPLLDTNPSNNPWPSGAQSTFDHPDYDAINGRWTYRALLGLDTNGWFGYSHRINVRATVATGAGANAGSWQISVWVAPTFDVTIGSVSGTAVLHPSNPNTPTLYQKAPYNAAEFNNTRTLQIGLLGTETAWPVESIKILRNNTTGMWTVTALLRLDPPFFPGYNALMGSSPMADLYGDHTMQITGFIDGLGAPVAGHGETATCIVTVEPGTA
jgi:hypothetical protein